MHTLHTLELTYIRLLHTYRTSVGDVFFTFMDFFDGKEFMLLLIPGVWYGISSKHGARLLYILIFSALINKVLKIAFGLPRPFHMDPEVGVIQVGSFGFPSGAAQTAVLLSGILIIEWENKWKWPIALSFGMLLCFSRVYLGVHFPSDILGGVVVGLLLLLVYYRCFPLLENDWSKGILWRQFASILLLPVILVLFFKSTSSLSLLKSSFLSLGVGIGLLVNQQCNLFLELPRNLWQRISRPLLVIAGVFVIHMTWNFLKDSCWNILGRLPLQLFHYLIIGLWLSLIPNFILRLRYIKSSDEFRENP